MTVTQRIGGLAMVALSVLVLPGRVVEEGLHALAALPWARVVSVRLNPRAGTAKTVVQYREETPRWAIRFGYVLPEAAATVTGVIVIGYWLLGGVVWWPATTLDWLLFSLLGAQYLAIALPSAHDLDHTPTGGGGE